MRLIVVASVDMLIAPSANNASNRMVRITTEEFSVVSRKPRAVEETKLITPRSGDEAKPLLNT